MSDDVDVALEGVVNESVRRARGSNDRISTVSSRSVRPSGGAPPAATSMSQDPQTGVGYFTIGVSAIEGGDVVAP